MDHMSDLPPGMAKALEDLDARAERAAARVDVERVAARVLSRLSAEPEAPMTLLGRVLGAPRAWRVAAAAALVVLGGSVTWLGLRHDAPPLTMTATGGLPVAGVDSLDQQQAESVLRAVNGIQPVNAAVPRASAVTMDDLSEQELRALLQAMQSREGAL